MEISGHVLRARAWWTSRKVCQQAVSYLVVSAIALLGLKAPAVAADGVIEINQEIVTAAGGFPFVISQSGSYMLTGDLTPPANTSGIAIDTSNVTLDLNGFSIIGPGSGSGGSAFNGVGIQARASGLTNLTVRNGTVRGMSLTGVGTGSGCSHRIENVKSADNGGFGILCGCGCIVTNSIADNNGMGGIRLASFCRETRN